ncbi:MAG: DNA-processing protein DprA [Candidatus Eiseniibacteriota bacterium]
MNRRERIRIGVAVASGLGPVAARRVCEQFGGWEEAVAAAREGLVEGAAARIAVAGAEERGEQVARDCARLGLTVLFLASAEWPAKLACLTDPPEVLFCRGRLGLLAERAVGVVGSRETSAAGADLAARLAERLAEEGWAVVSGLARGIDACAHRGALSAGGDTIAVLGCGPDVAYPPENEALLARIAEQGLVVSEFAPGTPPRAAQFPRRNRVLAGLADAVVVVESRLRSGALVTAKYALDQGKELYAVPGWPSAALSQGPLQLLRQGAHLIRDADDLIEDLGGIPGGPRPGRDELEVLAAVRDGAETEAALARRLGVSREAARERLARLELLGLVQPGVELG